MIRSSVGTQSQTPLVGTAVNKFTHMLQRVEEKDVHAMIEDSKPSPPAAAAASAAHASAHRTWNDSGDALAAEPLAPECTIDDFAKVDLRVARVIAAEDVPDARKLLKLTLSLGGGTTKNVFAGIKEAYKPAGPGRPAGDLRGESRAAKNEIRHERRDGRAAGPGGAEVFVITVDTGPCRVNACIDANSTSRAGATTQSLANSPGRCPRHPPDHFARFTRINSPSLRANTLCMANAGCDHTVIRRCIG